MQYPLISEYVDAIRSAEDNFDKLCDLRPVLDDNGNPIMSSGNFAVVFKMKDVNTGKLYAVKCFTKEQEGRKEAYRQIADELEFVQSTYFAKVKYYDRELFVDTQSSDDSEFPVLLMDWVEGETLDKYIHQNINDTYALEMLAYNFSRLAMWLLPQPFAHGDLKPDNILVHDDSSLTLVDYDGMFVPVMQGQKSRELGSPDFRHPLRTENDFNEHIDDLPAISILLSLRLIASAPSLLDKYGASDRLLFSESDYRDLQSCELLKSVFPSKDAEINTLVSLFTITCTHKTLANVSFRLLTIAKPNKTEIIEMEEELSTVVTDEDLANAILDEFGTKYSEDGKRLLKGVNIEQYDIKKGTKVICDKAFQQCFHLQKITIPESVINIGNETFSWCNSMEEITIPSNVKKIGDKAFWWCHSLQQITIPKSVKEIGKNPFLMCYCNIISESPKFKVIDDVLYNADKTILISFLADKEKFSIPLGVKSIDDRAFSECYSLQQISIPSSVTNIGNCAFSECHSLQQISIPSSVTSIGHGAFSECHSLQKIIIPSSVTSIGNSAFFDCDSLQQVTISSSVINIGNGLFSSCKSLQQITIPMGVTNIGNGAFLGCCSLLQIKIPSSVKSIGNSAFLECSSLQKIKIPSGITSIGGCAFFRCHSLQEIEIPSSVTIIGSYAFSHCNSLQVIKIPKNSRDKFEKILPDYKNKIVEVDTI